MTISSDIKQRTSFDAAALNYDTIFHFIMLIKYKKLNVYIIALVFYISTSLEEMGQGYSRLLYTDIGDDKRLKRLAAMCNKLEKN